MEPIREMTLRPVAWKLFLTQLLLLLLVYSFAIWLPVLLGRAEGQTPATLLSDLLANWPLHAGLVLGASVLVAILSSSTYIIRITRKGILEGPSSGLWTRSRFPLADMNR